MKQSFSIVNRLDLRPIPFILALMWISLSVISMSTVQSSQDGFMTSYVRSQLIWFCIGSVCYLGCAFFDYRRLKDYSAVIYCVFILLLLGLFLTNPIQNVRRWFVLPGLGVAFQPSEYGKLAIIVMLSTFLERQSDSRRPLKVFWLASLIVLVPFLLILKQPDLGTALILLPISLVMFYFGGVHLKLVKVFWGIALCSLTFVLLLFLGIFSHEEIKPYASKVVKPYQFERLNPNTYHQNAAKVAIALGSFKGSGWKHNFHTLHRLLPAAHTDSVFPAFTERYGFVGAVLMLLIFFGLIFFSFQVASVAPDLFGRLLSAGVAAYLAIHVVINMGMMCGLLPITGVPLILVSYGGSSVLSTMIALGLLQSVYIRRFQF